jgi:hypothetical protein
VIFVVPGGGRFLGGNPGWLKSTSQGGYQPDQSGQLQTGKEGICMGFAPA